VFDLRLPEAVETVKAPIKGRMIVSREKAFFWVVKRFYDLGLGLLLLPLLVFFSLSLLMLNPFFNRGSLFFIQKRMGKNCIPFLAIKFRSMAEVRNITRGPEDPIEHHRISAFGRFLRKSRVDELPQILNVLKGDMSLIGPRPDYYEHALVYLNVVPNYAIRYSVRPGISGLAQVVVGYVSDSDGTCRKVAADIAYIENVDYRLEWKIIVKTIQTIVTFGGA
jgi:lipopolysaccharide/colanic/teichoic acid biosynthesis glycosyltransferase